jgi:hypothetical protein
MIVSDLSAPVERVSLPEPRRSLAFVPSEGWESVLYAGTSGRVWRLDFGPVARLDMRATGVLLPSSAVEAIDFAADRAVIEYDDQLHVFDLSSGRVLLRVRADEDCFGACLTPDGRNLIWFESELTRIWPLDDEHQTPPTTRLFHADSIDKLLFGNEPYSAARVTAPPIGGGFHVVVGHYGFAVDYSVSHEGAAPLRLVLDAEPRIHHGFVFDPVQVLPGSRYPFVAANHGWGGGLKLIDVVGGGLRDCPEVQTGAPGSYARFRWTIPSRDQDKMLVKTADGWLLWDLTTNISNWFCPLELEPLHFGGGCLWATLADDPTALLRYAVAA